MHLLLAEAHPAAPTLCAGVRDVRDVRGDHDRGHGGDGHDDHGRGRGHDDHDRGDVRDLPAAHF